MGRIEALDLSERVSTSDYNNRLIAAQRRFLQLRLHLGGQLGSGEIGPALLLVFEGPDAAGKGGAIRQVVTPLDPRHFSVFSFSKPTWDEKRHHFLWRFYRDLPGLGGMAVFDRSWYGRVLVERIEKFATDEQWGRAYEEIVQFESTLVREGMILGKFWLHISDQEQLRRFRRRQSDPLKRWKLTEEDWRNRERNRDYDLAAEDMFARTDHELAPWQIISGEHKKFARVRVLEALNPLIEAGMQRFGMPVPTVDEVDELPDDDG